MTTPRKIVFLGTHGQYNIGDELLLDTFLTQLGDEHHYVVNSYDPAFTKAQLADRFSVEVIDTAGDRRRLLAALRGCDLLCFGGGSIVKELYASTGRNRYSTLLMILAIVSFTRLVARKPITMLNVGVGPVTTRFGLFLTRLILSQVDLLAVRDERSATVCRSVGVEPVVATDAVFAVGEEELLGGPSEARDAPGPILRVALNLNFDIENPDNWEPFLEQLALALTELNEQRPIEIHALPMQIGFKHHDDAKILAAFATRVPSIPFIPHPLSSHTEAARLIESCDLVVSERLHAIVLASILGVPTYVLAYDVKVSELATTLGIEPWSLDINTPFEAETVVERLTALIENREAVSAHVSARSGELRARARQGFEVAREWMGRPSRARASEREAVPSR